MESAKVLIVDHIVDKDQAKKTVKNIKLELEQVEIPCARCEQLYKICDWKSTKHWKNCKVPNVKSEKLAKHWEKQMKICMTKH